MITDFKDLDLSKKYTYSDYLTWKFKERVELFRGWVKKMSPAPSRRHQEISIFISSTIYSFLPKEGCKVYSAPFDVRLPVSLSKDRSDTVVQPDITVVCDLSKLDEQGCAGAPDLVIEILSLGNTKKEMKEKLKLYEEAGVPEYWVIDPEHSIAFMYLLGENGVYQASLPYTDEDTLESKVLPGLNIPVKTIFES